MMKKYINKTEAAEFFPPLQSKMNKGDAGRVLMVCGSYDPSGLSMCGAAYFAASAAYRCGAGVVEIFTARENYAALANLVPEAVFSLYGYDENASDVAARLAVSVAKSDGVVLGCGLGKSKMARALTESVFRNISCPLLIDADGLNILSEDESLWSHLDAEQRKRTVITPHPGEMARLTGKNIPEILENIPSVAAEFAREKGIICLLKDHNTAISDGDVVYINQSGNPGMATAGSGDVLSGIIGALIAKAYKQGSGGENAAILRRAAVGAFLHGCAGDVAAERIGQYALTASEILAEIPAVIGGFFG